MSRQLHIVCLDAPYPPDYGGAVEMFAKIRALHAEGIKIHLHYFVYGRVKDVTELKRYCETIHSYVRTTGRKGFSLTLPYIVSSRLSDELVANLNNDEFPILLEGVHCTGVLKDIDHRKKIVVRLHNDESLYYKKLAKYTPSVFRKMFFLNESRLLNHYQHQLPHNQVYACISAKDAIVFRNKYDLPNVKILAPFTCWSAVNGKEGVGNFCLYHGNLSVPENEKAACWLLDKVFTKIKIPFVIAGKAPSRRLVKWAHLCQHTCLIADPSEKEINDLVQKAHINVLPAFNNTGIKLKLLHALYSGRHCVVNPEAVGDSELEPACHVGSNADAIASIILQLYHQPFGEEEIKLREKILSNSFNNEANARKLIAWLY